jgi:hypothetical protein
MNEWVRRQGGFITSPPGKLLRIEVPKNSELPAKLRELGYNVAACGSETRVTGAQALTPRIERMTGAPSAFVECDILEVRLDGK